MNKKSKQNKKDQRLARKLNFITRLLPATLIQKPQTYGAGSTVATFEKQYTSQGVDVNDSLLTVIANGQQVPAAYFTQYKFFKIISVVVAASPSTVGGQLLANVVWAGPNFPNLEHDDTTKRVPISTNKTTYAIFIPPKVIVSHAALAQTFVTDLGRYTCTDDHIVNGTVVIPGGITTNSPANVKYTIYVKIEFRGQRTDYYDQP